MNKKVVEISLAAFLAAYSLTVTAGFGQQPSPAPGPAAGQSGDEKAIIMAILTRQVVRIVEGNITAAERENGEIAKLVRALSGVSIKDIEAHGICGGSNSEVRKLFGDLCK